MATYLKRTSKLFDLSLSRPTADVNLRDLMCPVCRGILIEPVTLPCTHNLCLRCLKGTFEHNSLSCPLCRIRVGSWLRTATKTETLVNNGLWELIRAKFPKEVEDKYNGDDRDIELDAGFSAANKILSAAGEIRREYEAQLQMAEKEIRCQREAEQMASEALIRKIQAEEQQQQLAQLAQDQLFAKSLAKSQLVKKEKEVPKYFSEHSDVAATSYSFDTSKFNFSVADVGPPKRETQTLESGKINLLEVRDGSELRRSNIALISKIRAERYASSMKANASGIGKDSSSVFCCQKSVPVYNAITRTLKHQTVTKTMQPSTSSFVAEPSTSKIYGMQSKEELHVPNDVVNSKKKSLGVEVCMTVADDDGRIGSAESAGSHDSINQEIHHFKPIKAMPRTPLKISTDGRQIDPKLIRVVPIVKRISNVVPKPPSQVHLNRIVGCSWSAFRGKVRQNSREKEVRRNPESAEETEHGASTSQDQPGLNRPTKSQSHDIIRRLDFVPEISSDANKNHTKNSNRIINGTKVSKKLTMEEHVDVGKVHKSWKTHVRNGMISKSKRQRNVWVGKKDRVATDTKDPGEKDNDNGDGNGNGNDNDDNDAEYLAVSSPVSAKTSPPCDEQSEEQSETDATVENIAERIKRRKVNVAEKTSNATSNLSVDSAAGYVKRSTRKRKEDLEYATAEETVALRKKSRSNFIRVTPSRSRGTRGRPAIRSTVDSEKSDSPVERNSKIATRKSQRKGKRANGSCRRIEEADTCEGKSTGDKRNYNSSESCGDPPECEWENNNATESEENANKDVSSDDDVVNEQKRMERLVIQEKEDFELALRLQAKFDEMERIAGRTRRSRRAIESGAIEIDLYEIEIGRTVEKTENAHTAKRSIIDRTMNSEAKRRGRPSKQRVK